MAGPFTVPVAQDKAVIGKMNDIADERIQMSGKKLKICFVSECRGFKKPGVLYRFPDHIFFSSSGS
jgi:hypothetical protein